PRRRNLRCRRRRWHSAHMRRRVPRTGGRMALLPFQAHHQASSTTTSPPSTDSICSSSRRLSDRALTSSLIDSNALLIIWKNVATRMEQLILERPHHARVLIVGLARLLDLTASTRWARPRPCKAERDPRNSDWFWLTRKAKGTDGEH